MVLVDTSVWVDHLRTGQLALARLLNRGLVLAHPWVIGELVLGNLSQRQDILGLLSALPSAEIATDAEVLELIEAEQLYGLGVGYVDAQLLAATRLTAYARLWTTDKAQLGPAPCTNSAPHRMVQSHVRCSIDGHPTRWHGGTLHRGCRSAENRCERKSVGKPRKKCIGGLTITSRHKRTAAVFRPVQSFVP